MGTVDGYLLAIDAGTSEPSSGFGREGRVDLLEEWSQVARSRYTVTSPPIVVGNVVVVGSGLNDTIGAAQSQPPGDVRGFDATGSPMTYMIGGRQFIVVAVGGSNLPAELVALALE